MSTTQAETDASLIARAQAGDRAAFDKLLDQFRESAIRYAASRLRGRTDAAEDAVQAAFVEAWRDLPTLRNPQAFPAWLRRLVFKQCDRLCRGIGSQTIPLDDSTPAIDTVPGPGAALIAAQERSQQRSAARLLIGLLPPGERKAILLFYLGECSYRDVAEYLGISITAVKSRLHSARTRIHERSKQMLELTSGDIEPSATVLDLTESERKALLQEIGEFYENYAVAFDVCDPELVLPLYTSDYELIFPAGSGIPTWDLSRVEKDCRAGGPRPAGSFQMHAEIENLISAERDTATGRINKCVVSCTFIKDGAGFKHKEPVHRIDTFVQRDDEWKNSRTICLHRDDNRPDWVK